MTFLSLFRQPVRGDGLQRTLLMVAIATAATCACGGASWQRVSTDTRVALELPKVSFTEPSSRTRRMRFQKAPDDCVLRGKPRPDMASIVWLALRDNIKTGQGGSDVFVFRPKDASQSTEMESSPLRREKMAMVLLDIREQSGKLVLDVPLDYTVYCLEFRYEGGALVHITVDDVNRISASTSTRRDHIAELPPGSRPRHASTEPTTSNTSELPR
jgi:hypothetical protein